MTIEIDKSAWSESSKRSEAFNSLVTHYEDLSYRCYKCGQAEIFTAVAQKEAYEVRKDYIWKTRTLCGPCKAELDTLRQRDRDLQLKWDTGSNALKRDQSFLRDWIAVLEAIPRYGKRANESMVVALKSLLREPI